MASLKFALYLMCLFLGRTALTKDLKLSLSVRQEGGFLSPDVGAEVTLRCFYKGDVAAMFYWYKQSLGQKPQLVSTFYKHDKKGTFSDEFKDNSRFKLEANNDKYHLIISDLHTSDSGTYYCISCHSFKFEFAEGITLNVKGSDFKIYDFAHLLESEGDQQGDSGNLKCGLNPGNCDDGKHSVYWFQHSEKAHPGLIYTHGGKNNRCNTSTETNTCVYNLPSLNSSKAGMDCAVALCGQTLYGDKTKQKYKVGSYDSLVKILSAAVAFTTILVLVLAFSLCIMNKKNRCQAESKSISASTPSSAEGYEDADNIHYAALRDHKVKRPRRKMDDSMSQCVYSSVRS